MAKKLKKKTSKVKRTPAKERKYAVITATLDDMPITETFNQLQENLKIDTRKMSRGELLEAMDRASTLRWKAGLLYVDAKKEKQTIEASVKVKLGQLEIRARKYLATLKRKKKEGSIEGMITKEFIENTMAARYPEYRQLQRRLIKAERNERALKILYETWESRTSLLQTQSRMIGVKVVPGQAITE